MATTEAKAVTYTRYPFSGLASYNGSTALHYLVGVSGIMVGYGSLAGYVIGGLYVTFAFVQMYLLMPLSCRWRCAPTASTIA